MDNKVGKFNAREISGLTKNSSCYSRAPIPLSYFFICSVTGALQPFLLAFGASPFAQSISNFSN